MATKSFYSLLKLSCLGFIGGSIIALSENILPLWGYSQNITLPNLGKLNLFFLFYSLRILWTPFISLKAPPLGFSFFGKEKGWLVFFLCGIVSCLLLLSFFPFNSYGFIFIIIILTCLRASLDLFIIAAQRNTTPPNLWGMSENFCENGYLLGETLIGSLALLLSSLIFSWPSIYQLLSIGIFFIAMITLLLCTFPDSPEKPVCTDSSLRHFFSFFQEFFTKKENLMILLFMLFYRFQDSLFSPLKDIFYLDIGFSKKNIASFLKSGEMVFRILGGFSAGFMIRAYTYQETLRYGLFLHSGFGVFLGTLLFVPCVKPFLCVPILLLSFSGGLTTIAFYSFQLLCCRKEYLLAQIALLSFFSDFSWYCVGSTSGMLVTHFGWSALLFIGGSAALFVSPLSQKLFKHMFTQENYPLQNPI